MSDALSRDELAFLKDHGFNEREFLQRQALIRSGELTDKSGIFKGALEPPTASDLLDLPVPGSPEGRALAEQGEALLRAGKVARLVLAGGKATRFGGGVKGAVDVLPGESFLGLLLRDARAAGARYGKPVPFVIMSSDGSTELIREHLESRGLWGEDILVFEQGLSARLTPQGELYRGPDGKLSYYPPGHGDFFRAFRESGTLATLRGRGVEQLFFSNVDNLGASLDPRLIGLHARHKVDMTVEVTSRIGNDVAGAPVRGDGRVRLLEGFRFPKDAEPSRYPSISINSYFFTLGSRAMDVLGGEVPLVAYLTTKKVDGRPVLQAEMVTGEATEALYPSGAPVLVTQYVRVPRAGPPGRFYAGRFYPVKERAHLEDVSRELAFTRLREAFEARFAGQRAPLWMASAGGRLNVLGEHTDYAQGLALPAAIQRRVRGAFQAAEGRKVELWSQTLGAACSFSLDAPPLLAEGDWGRYVVAAFKTFEAHAAGSGKRLPGVRAVVQSDLPPGSGLSSSAALLLVLLQGAAKLAGVTLSPVELAQLAQRAEWESGVKTGLLDQLGIALAKKGQVSLLDTRSLTATPVPVQLKDHAWLVAFTKARTLAGSAYAQRREEVERAAQLLREASKDERVKTLRDVSPAFLKAHEAALPPLLQQRARHVVSENARVGEAAAALSGGDVEKVKALMAQTHRSLREDFQVSSPELDAVVDAAAAWGKERGVSLGARMMGGGFGGPVLLLVPQEQLEPAKRALAERYQKAVGQALTFFDVSLEDGLEMLGPVELVE